MIVQHDKLFNYVYVKIPDIMKYKKVNNTKKKNLTIRLRTILLQIIIR